MAKDASLNVTMAKDMAKDASLNVTMAKDATNDIISFFSEITLRISSALHRSPKADKQEKESISRHVCL